VFGDAFVVAGLRCFTQITSKGCRAPWEVKLKRLKDNAWLRGLGLAENLRHVEYSRPVSRSSQDELFKYRAKRWKKL
jgi:hypothetical protein